MTGKQQQGCYFCPETAESTLHEHHVYPKELRRLANGEVDVEKTVTLCGNCHRKFHDVLDPALKFMSDLMRQRIDTPESLDEYRRASKLAAQKE